MSDLFAMQLRSIQRNEGGRKMVASFNGWIAVSSGGEKLMFRRDCVTRMYPIVLARGVNAMTVMLDDSEQPAITVIGEDVMLLVEELMAISNFPSNIKDFEHMIEEAFYGV